MPHSGQSGVIVKSSGLNLLGTLFLAPGDVPKTTVLLLHGIPGIEKNYDIAHALREQGLNALLFHYRGSWGSEGRFDVLSQPRDVIAAVEFLQTGAFPSIDGERIAAFGHSLGGYAGLTAAAFDPRIRALAVAAPVCDFNSMPLNKPEIAAEFVPFLHGVTEEELARQFAAIGPDLNPIDLVERIAPRPLLIMHGTKDLEVPVAQSRALAERAGANSRLVEHPEANHSFTWHRDWLRSTLLDWLGEIQPHLV